MNDVILIAGDGRARMFAEAPNGHKPHRYTAFREAFGADGFGIVEAGALKREILGGERAPVYLLDENLRPVVSPKSGIESSLIIASNFENGGKGVAKVGAEDVAEKFGDDVSRFIVQEELDIESESRLIFFNGQYLGARIIHDRTRPWEVRGQSGREHDVQRYDPSGAQIDEARDIMKYSETIWGCVDWAHDSDGNFKFLELNGVGTGLGKPGAPYNLNKTVALKIRDKYLE
jgi:hypothetical protein